MRVTNIVTINTNKISAIKAVREKYPNFDLREAKEVVEMVLTNVTAEIERGCNLGHTHTEVVSCGEVGHGMISIKEDPWS